MNKPDNIMGEKTMSERLLSNLSAKEKNEKAVEKINENYREWNKAMRMQGLYLHYKELLGYAAMEELREMFAYMSYYNNKQKEVRKYTREEEILINRSEQYIRRCKNMIYERDE